MVLSTGEDCQSRLHRLRDEFVFDMLEAETAVDYWPGRLSALHVIYQLCSTKNNISAAHSRTSGWQRAVPADY